MGEVINYLDIHNKYEPIKDFLQGKRRKQFNKLAEWKEMEQYYMSLMEAQNA